MDKTIAIDKKSFITPPPITVFHENGTDFEN
jgi:hypothetical protein